MLGVFLKDKNLQIEVVVGWPCLSKDVQAVASLSGDCEFLNLVWEDPQPGGLTI